MRAQGDRFGENISAPEAIQNAYRVSVYSHLQVSRWRKMRRKDSAHREGMGILGYNTKHQLNHKILYYRHTVFMICIVLVAVSSCTGDRVPSNGVRLMCGVRLMVNKTNHFNTEFCSKLLQLSFLYPSMSI